ncbi:hypothetical protein [Bradyrhizobium japonicum]|uniref:hypothetical protein n=1 Tax=Bradyrhizobium japonicum TaxID=375 RepID=UPI000A95E887|nr:hypothetical protein [Bradyrhizobium japonicum]
MFGLWGVAIFFLFAFYNPADRGAHRPARAERDDDGRLKPISEMCISIDSLR